MEINLFPTPNGTYIRHRLEINLFPTPPGNQPVSNTDWKPTCFQNRMEINLFPTPNGTYVQCQMEPTSNIAWKPTYFQKKIDDIPDTERLRVGCAAPFNSMSLFTRHYSGIKVT